MKIIYKCMFLLIIPGLMMIVSNITDPISSLHATGGEVVFGERPFIDIYTVPDEAMKEGRFVIKFHAGFTEHLDNTEIVKDENGIIVFNIPELDLLNQEFGINEAIRSFDTPALKNPYELRHRLWGFHLWYELHFDSAEDIRDIIMDYRDLESIISWAEPQYKKQLLNDPLLPDQWHYNNTGQAGGTPGADISLFSAWDIEKGHPDVIVAVIDSGIDHEHVDLAGNMWSGIGFNFVDNTYIIDPGNHGTHVAGTVAAVSNNNIGVAGVAGGSGTGDGVSLMSCQVFSSCESYYDGFHLAPVYAADNGAAISQNSWGYTVPGVYDQPVMDAIDYFNMHGGGSVMYNGITIFAAGNSFGSGLWYPACYSGAFSVAATNNHDEKAQYSTYDTWVDISAPGGETHLVTERGVLSTVINNQYAYYDGTSMACPHVSGVAALLLSKAVNNGVMLLSEEIATILRDTADDHYGVNPQYLGMLGTGRLNAYSALQEIPHQFAGGSGTEQDPWQIATAEHLDSVRNFLGEDNNQKYFIQTEDIDLGVPPWNEDTGWIPIGTIGLDEGFHGNYNGNGRTINNMFIHRDDNYQGLFGFTNHATISNLGMRNVMITATGSVGSLVGYSSYSTFENCYSTGNVTGIGNQCITGGLIGLLGQWSSVQECYNSANVSSDLVAGGLVGRSESSIITNSYNTGNVSGNGNTGGIAGNNHNGSISDSYNNGSVSGESNTGGLVGLNHGNISDSYNTGDVSGNNNIGGFVGYHYNGNISDSYNTGDVSGHSNIGGLVGYAYSDFINNCHNTGSVSGVNNTGGIAGQNNHTLFLYNNNSGDVSGERNIGGIVGQNNNNYVFYCYNTGNVTGDSNVGGLIGENNHGIRLSYNMGTVSGDSHVGGIVGENNGEVGKCHNIGAISGSQSIGGVAGSSHNSYISDSYNTGKVSGYSFIGGLAGNINNAQIGTSYSTGLVSGNNHVGGLIGESTNSIVSSCYWDKVTSCQESSAEGDGVLTVDMVRWSSGLYTHWNFTGGTGAWAMTDYTTYPYLQWQEEPGIHNYPPHGYHKTYQGRKYYWESFPVLWNRDNDGNQCAREVLEPLTYAEWIEVSNEDFFAMIWQQQEWQAPFIDFHSTRGYQLSFGTEDYHSFIVHGATATPQNIAFDDPEEAQVTISPQPHENWIGYFIPQTQRAERAFSSVLDNLKVIQAENWAMYKQPNGQWYYDGTREPMVVYGKMYKVIADEEVTEEFTFQWYFPDEREYQEERPKVEFFVFEEEPSYESFFVEEIDNDDDVLEVAVYAGDECVGASVFEGNYPFEILAYTNESHLNEDISFAVHRDGQRGEALRIRAVETKDMESGEFELRTIKPLRQRFTIVRLGTGEEEAEIIVNPEIALYQNYPNPVVFTAASRSNLTEIPFYVSGQREITLSVYNIRGQRVTTLYSGTVEAGKHSIGWNGLNEHNRQTGSGVYFYRLESGDKIVTRKLLLIR